MSEPRRIDEAFEFDPFFATEETEQNGETRRRRVTRQARCDCGRAFTLLTAR